MLQQSCAGRQVPPQAIRQAGERLNEASRIVSEMGHRWKKLNADQQLFMRGVAAVETESYSDAIQYLSKLRGRYQQLEDYTLYYLGRAALGANDPKLARESFTTLISKYPGSIWQHAANEGLVDAAILAKDYAHAEQLLSTILASAKREYSKRRLRERQANVAMIKGDGKLAAQRYHDLYVSAPYLDTAESAREGLDQVQKKFGINVLGSLSVGERSTLVEKFTERGMAREAVILLEAYPGSYSTAIMADAFFKAREYEKSARAYETLWRNGQKDLATLQILATSKARAQLDDEAIALQALIIQQYPGTQNARMALYKQSYLLADSGKYAQAARGYREWLGNKQSNNPLMLGAMWAIAWAEYQQGHYPQAIAALNQLSSQLESRDQYWNARTTYWRGRVLLAAGNKDEARAQFDEVARKYSGSYYGTLAARRARGQGTEDLFKQSSNFASLGMQPGELATTSKSAELLSIGLWDHAVEEHDYSSAAPIFSSPHRYAVDQLGAHWGIDPRLTLSVMRQESAFRVEVVSRAGAIGLLQLMPNTASKMAKDLGVNDFRVEDLFRALPNIKLGMWYLRGLLDRYHGTIPHALASYNAGEEAVDRWLQRRSTHDLEEFIEAIPFRETQDYVKRILSLYW